MLERKKKPTKEEIEAEKATALQYAERALRVYEGSKLPTKQSEWTQSSTSANGLTKSPARFTSVKPRVLPAEVELPRVEYPDPRRLDQYVCSECHYTVDRTENHGYKRDPQRPGREMPCPTCSKPVIRARNARIAAGWIEKLVETGKFTNMQNFPDDAHLYWMESYPERGDQQAKEKAQAFIEGTYHEIFFNGDAGLGKTGLMIAAAQELLRQGVSVLFLPMKSYISLLQDNFQRGAVNNHIKDATRGVEALFIDDLGTERVTDTGFTVEETQSLIEDRHARGLRTFFNSNMDIEGLKAYWFMPKYAKTKFQPANRLVSRITGWYECYTLDGCDLRQGE